MTAARDAARAIDAIRRGWPIAIEGEDGALTLLAVETADDARLADFDPRGQADLLISGERAAVLKLANQRDAAEGGGAVLVARTPWLDMPAALALADPAGDLATPLKDRIAPRRSTPPRPGRRRSRSPASPGCCRLFTFCRDGDAEARVGVAGIAAYDAPEALAIVTRARLPVTASTMAEIVAFRSPSEAGEHIALLIGAPDGGPPLVRLHSECLTGDVLGSLKCDCGPQLHAALGMIAARGRGILLYLRQEGRGIGLINKLRAYALQDQGFDTIEANLRLGFTADARDFGIAARMLRLLGHDEIRLLTNNPAKVDQLQAAGIMVRERVPHAMPANPHNAHYLAIKRDRTGHLL